MVNIDGGEDKEWSSWYQEWYTRDQDWYTCDEIWYTCDQEWYTCDQEWYTCDHKWYTQEKGWYSPANNSGPLTSLPVQCLKGCIADAHANKRYLTAFPSVFIYTLIP